MYEAQNKNKKKKSWQLFGSKSVAWSLVQNQNQNNNIGKIMPRVRKVCFMWEMGEGKKRSLRKLHDGTYSAI